MASTHVALIRGINVGRAKRVAMADLRAIATRLGFAAPRTLLNSGNLVFSARGAAPAAELAAQLEAALHEATGVSAAVIVLPADALAAVVAENPWADSETDPARLLVAVWREPGDRVLLAPLAAREWGAERLALGRWAAYLECTGGVQNSPVAAAVARTLGDRVTTRNWATTLKLRELALQ